MRPIHALAAEPGDAGERLRLHGGARAPQSEVNGYKAEKRPPTYASFIASFHKLLMSIREPNNADHHLCYAWAHGI